MLNRTIYVDDLKNINKLKSEKGITILTLVITVIIMVILAGVGINLAVRR